MIRRWMAAAAAGPVLASFAGARTPRIVEAAWYYDGGSVRVVYVDADGAPGTCCFDHRLDTDSPGRLYIGRSPTAPGARPALVDEERSILAALRAAVAAVYPPDAREALLAKRYDTEVSSLDYDAWLVMKELRRRGDL